jgi:hypothetical protein
VGAPVSPAYEKPHIVIVDTPLPPLKLMAQSRRGVVQVMEVQVRPLVMAIPRFIQGAT